MQGRGASSHELNTPGTFQAESGRGFLPPGDGCFNSCFSLLLRNPGWGSTFYITVECEVITQGGVPTFSLTLGPKALKIRLPLITDSFLLSFKPWTTCVYRWWWS